MNEAFSFYLRTEYLCILLNKKTRTNPCGLSRSVNTAFHFHLSIQPVTERRTTNTKCFSLGLQLLLYRGDAELLIEALMGQPCRKDHICIWVVRLLPLGQRMV